MMLKRERDEVVFDAFLSKAFAEAAMDEIKELEKTDIAEVELRSKHKREERRLYKQIERAKNRPAWRYTVNKIAACFLICVFVGIATIFAIPSARADVMRLIAKPFDKYTSFGTVTDSVFENAEYTFGYIPEGFEWVRYEKNNRQYYVFKNAFEDEFFEIKIYNSVSSGFLQNGENSSSKQIQINDYKAILTENIIEKTIIITWCDDECTFSLDGNIAEHVLINIAKNIKIKK